MAPRLPPQHAEKREAALRANLMRRKAQARAQTAEKPQEKPLLTETAPATDNTQ